MSACLLDISTLLAWLWPNHEAHDLVTAWQKGKVVAICPLTELGFLRISTQANFGATPDQARRMLDAWRKVRKPVFIPCDMSALDGGEPWSGNVTTDFYLADLAARHDMLWATLDEHSMHSNAEVIR
ncbi:MAG: hypothetical protein ABSC03_08180 [Verrucomicrobiota bacterium]|jgi:predicted nucleic acid-binding protein